MANILEIEPDVIEKVEDKSTTKKKNLNQLILHNTNYHTFEEVIECLMLYCGKTPEQAIDDAMTVHHLGKATVMEGTLNEIKPSYEALNEKTLKVTIE